MLVLTETAVEVVKSVTLAAPDLEGAGLRITATTPEPENPGALQLNAATSPAEDDQVIEAAGARIFVEPRAVAYLEDKVLDARLDDEGKAQFLLGVQAAS